MTVPADPRVAAEQAIAEALRRDFHLITDPEWAEMQAADLTWDGVAEKFKQPDWCGYPNALAGVMGCWSLVGRMVTGKAYCKRCDLCIEAKSPDGLGYTNNTPTPEAPEPLENDE